MIRVLAHALTTHAYFIIGCKIRIIRVFYYWT